MTDAWPVRIDLYVEETVLGSTSRFVLEAGISLWKPTVHALRRETLGAMLNARPDADGLVFFGIIWPYDLDDLPSSRQYVSGRVQVTFDSPLIRCLSLRWGKDQPRDNEVVHHFGVGSTQPSWKLTPASGWLQPGSRITGMILESPTDLQMITGRIDAEVTVRKTVLNSFESRDARPNDPMKFSLNLTNGECSISN